MQVRVQRAGRAVLLCSAVLAPAAAPAAAQAGGAAQAGPVGTDIEAAASAADASAAALTETQPEIEVGTGAGPGSGRRGQVTSLPLPRYVSMRAESANARRGPSLDQRVDWEFLKRGLPLRITAEYGQWRRVEDADGMGGWVHQALLSGTRTGLVRGDAAIELRRKAGEAAGTVALLEPGVIVRVNSCGGAWCAVSAGKFDGYLPEAVLWGVDPGETFD